MGFHKRHPKEKERKACIKEMRKILEREQADCPEGFEAIVRLGLEKLKKKLKRPDHKQLTRGWAAKCFAEAKAEYLAQAKKEFEGKTERAKRQNRGENHQDTNPIDPKKLKPYTKIAGRVAPLANKYGKTLLECSNQICDEEGKPRLSAQELRYLR